MDPVALARIQFAVTVAYHFLFVPLSIGIGLVMVMAERQAYKNPTPENKAASKFWIKIFTATFAIGVATGITMEFSFGTNWANYSRFVGDIFGAPLAAEALFAFFLESTFLGVLLFGRNRVSPKFYYVSAWLVWAGSMLSALWIIIANSWMQTPAGFKIVETSAGRKAELTNFFAAAFNPSTLPRYFHTVDAVLIVGGFIAAAIGAWYYRKGRDTRLREVVDHDRPRHRAHHCRADAAARPLAGRRGRGQPAREGRRHGGALGYGPDGPRDHRLGERRQGNHHLARHPWGSQLPRLG